MLPDEVLVGIFDFYVYEREEWGEKCNTTWETLVHVCRRWRYIVFAAPRRLGLRLLCTPRTRVKEMLNIWPAFPIELRASDPHSLNEDNIIAMLGHNDRLCRLLFRVIGKDSLERLAAAMQVPFPSLTHLFLHSSHVVPPTLPDVFLGGSTPGLRSLYLHYIAAPGLPKLLLSATGLIRLRLENMPHSWYIPPYVMANCLSSLTRLEELGISFLSPPLFEQESQQAPPPIRTILPKLNSLSFLKGPHEYLEVLFTWIDAPLHDYIFIYFFNPAIFDTSQMSLFNGREELIQAPDRAYMHFDNSMLYVKLLSSKGTTHDISLLLSSKCGDLAWQLLALFQTRSQLSPSSGFSSSRSDGDEPRCSPLWASNMENVRWLEFLHFFSAVETLYLSEGVALCIAPALRELTTGEGGVVRVLSALKNLFIGNLEPSESGPLLEPIKEFDVARESAGHTVVVQRWEEE